MDIFQPEWFKDCKKSEVQLDPEAVWRLFWYFTVSPSVIPLTIDEARARHMAVITRSMLPGFGPGFLMFDTYVPETGTSDGWIVPAKPYGVIRNMQNNVVYREPSADFDGTCVDVTQVLKISCPVPRFFQSFALNMCKRIISDVIITMGLKMKEGFIDNFSELEHSARMATFPDVFNALAEIRNGR